MESQTREAIPGGEQGRANSAKPLLIGSLLIGSCLSGRQTFSVVGHPPCTPETSDKQGQGKASSLESGPHHEFLQLILRELLQHLEPASDAHSFSVSHPRHKQRKWARSR